MYKKHTSELESAVELNKVSKIYPGTPVIKALSDVSLSVNSGEFVGIVGASGSGKSTLLHVIGTLTRPSEGSVNINGLNTAGMSDSDLSGLRAKFVGFVFQDFFLLPGFSAIENVENALKLIESNNPMEGVFMLRKILEKEPKNKEALFNLGVLSIQSKQYDKAIERFNQLLIIDSLDKRAYLHLGISNFELGNEEEANFFFDKVLRSNNNLLIEQLNLFLNKQ